MTATEELRRLLDERGVEYTIDDDERVRETCWPYMGELMAAFTEYNDGTTRFACDTWCFTPEQTIAATLGRGKCHIVKTWSDSDYDEDWRYRCSECRGFIPVDERDPDTGDVVSAANFCPNCGIEVEL